MNLKTASSRDDYYAAVIANRKGAPLTQALVPSKHPTTDSIVPETLTAEFPTSLLSIA